MQLATVLRNRRKELNLTQQDLADQLHVTRQTLSRWENNSAFPNLDTVVQLSKILEISLDTLLKGEDNMVVKNISSEVRKKKKMQYSLIAFVSILILWLALLFFGRTNQIEQIDRFNPFLPTRYGYAVLPNKPPKSEHRVDAFVSDDPFGKGEWLKFYTGLYSKENRWALVKHKGSYVSNIRLVKKNQIPLEMREQAGSVYIPYDKHSPRRYTSIFP